MTRVTREPRRLETGDWVRVRGDDPSIRGVGKIIDAAFAPEDDALTACEVEVGARRVWLSPAELARVTPDEEARLCEVALARGLVPAEKRARLDDALRELRAGKRAVIRTPGLVDLLWATSTLADPTHGSGAVTAFLAEEAVVALPPRHAALAPDSNVRGRADAHEGCISPEEVLMRIFDLLSARLPLYPLAARLGLDARASEGRLSPLREALRALPPAETLDRVLERLTTDELAALAQRMGVRDPAQRSESELRVRIMAIVDPGPEAPGGSSSTISGPLSVTLTALDRETLVMVATACAVSLGPAPALLNALDLQRRILAAGVTSDQVLRALDGRLPTRGVLSHVLALMTRYPLRNLAERCRAGSTADANAQELREAILKLPPAEPLRRALPMLSRNELELIARHLGLAIESPETLRVRLATVAGLPAESAPEVRP